MRLVVIDFKNNTVRTYEDFGKECKKSIEEFLKSKNYKSRNVSWCVLKVGKFNYTISR